MKKIIVAVSLALASATAAAHQPHHHHGHNAANWIVPLAVGAVIGGVVGYNAPVYSAPVPVYAPPVYQYPRPVMQAPNAIYNSVDVYIPECNCYRTVQVRVQ